MNRNRSRNSLRIYILSVTSFVSRRLHWKSTLNRCIQRFQGEGEGVSLFESATHQRRHELQLLRAAAS